MGPVRVQRDVVRFDKRTSNISTDDEPNTVVRDLSNMLGISRRYLSILTRYEEPLQKRLRSVLSTRAKWRPPKTEKV